MRKINSHDALMMLKNYIQGVVFPEQVSICHLHYLHIHFIFEIRFHCVVLAGLEDTDPSASVPKGLGLKADITIPNQIYNLHIIFIQNIPK